MRPIKFRVMLNEKSANPGMVIYIVPWKLKAWDKVDLNTLSQFTGLHDKNGKEIYEGDIVSFEVENNSLWCGPRIGLIKFNEKNSSFEIYLEEVFLSIGRGYDAYKGTLLIEANIHETPELNES